MRKTDKRGEVIAFCGTRGVPARYGGFETAVDEISRRFVARGWSCEVFCRSHGADHQPPTHDGRRLVHVKGSSRAKLDTVVSAWQTGWYLWRHRRQYRHVFWFNTANLPGIVLTWLAGIPMSVNTDGLEWRRAKWSLPFKMYSFVASFLVTRLCRSLISDSLAIQEYYRRRFGRESTVIPYGAPSPTAVDPVRAARVLERLGLETGRYFLQITRFEPDNLPLAVAQAFAESGLSGRGFRMLLVGYRSGSPYAEQVKRHDGRDGVIVHEAIYDPEVLAVLRGHCLAYVHGNSVGGTNPALLEAMASCPRVLAIDSPFSREVLGPLGHYFTLDNLAPAMCEMIHQPEQRERLRQRVYDRYQWDAVAAAYMQLADGLPAEYRPVPAKRRPDVIFAASSD